MGCSGNALSPANTTTVLPEMRPILADRLAAGLQTAWEKTEKVAPHEVELDWASTKVTLPPGEWLASEELEDDAPDREALKIDRLQAARTPASFCSAANWSRGSRSSRLRIGNVDLLQLAWRCSWNTSW